jgi:hypothetical protein
MLMMAGTVRAQAFKAGFAERDITPAIGMEHPGGYGKAYHRIFHDACKVRAAVFDDGNGRVALVGIDALIIRRPSVEAARQRIHEKCGIDEKAILIGASHSHSAGPTGMVLPGEYDDAPEFIRSLAYDKSSCADAGYLKRVEDAIAEAVVEANENRVPARCNVGRGSEDKAAFNRRFHMKDGLTWTHPGQGNPDIIEPAGPIDPEVGVIGAWDAKDGKLLGCIVNYACHATTGPGGISADWIYYLERTIRGTWGGDAVVVFLQGACGDITQVDNRCPYDIKQSGEAISRVVGGRVGAEAVKTLLSIQSAAGDLGPVKADAQLLEIKHRTPRPERVEHCGQIVKKGYPKGPAADATEWTFAKEVLMLDWKLKRQPLANVEVQAIQIGPAVIVANPAEYFCQYGLDIKKASNFPFTFVSELSNDCVGYVPTEQALGPHGGGYETRLTSYSNLEVAAGTIMKDAMLALAKKFAPAQVLQPKPAPPFKGKPWRYGEVPPELD